MLCSSFPSTKNKVQRSRIRRGPRRDGTPVLIDNWSRVRISHFRAIDIYVAARRGVRVIRSNVCWRSIRVQGSIRVAVRVLVGVRVFVSVLRFWPLWSVLVAVCVCVSFFAGFVGSYGFGRLACFRQTAEIHGHSLTCLDHLSRSRQLKDNCVGLRLIAGPVRADTKLQISFSQDLLCIKSIFADDIRNRHFRTAQRQIHRGGHSEEKNNCDRNDDCDASEHRCNSGN